MVGRLSWRRLWHLTTNLPTDAATVRAMYPRAQWSNESHMLAAVIDLLQAANWQRGGKKSAPKPKPIKRPGDDRKNYGTSRTASDFDAVYARALERVKAKEEAGEVVWQ